MGNFNLGKLYPRPSTCQQQRTTTIVYQGIFIHIRDITYSLKKVNNYN